MGNQLIFTIGTLGASMIAIVLLGTAVLLRNPKKGLHQSFFALSLSAAFWILTNMVFAVVPHAPTQYVAALLSYGAAAFLALFFLRYCLELAAIKMRRSTTTSIVGIGIAVSIASMLPNLISTGVSADNKVITNVVPLMFYGVYMLVYMGAGLLVLLRTRTRAKGVERDKVTIVLLGLVFSALVGLFFNLILPMFGNYSFVKVGPVATLILVGSSTYAIVRHRLFDIKLAAVRTAAYILALVTLSGIYYVLAYFLSIAVFRDQVNEGISVSPVNIFLALLLAFVFQPIKRFFDKVTNDIFYRDSYSTSEFFAKLNHLLTSTTDLRGLLERASVEIATTLKAEQALFFLFYTRDIDRHMSAGTRGYTRMPVHDARMLDEYVSTSGTGIFLTEIMDDDARVQKMLKSHKIALVMPLRHGDKITGYVMLGEHRSGNYTKRDLNVLSTISDGLVIAIQNALSLHEVKELNATLQQRIDVATKELRSSNAQLKHLDEVKNEFMSMASHQLRTPLTSVKGYISMVLEGDAGKITPQQQKLLVEAYKSSERMVGLIADFLNVSRLQTGKFVLEKTPFDLGDIVRQEAANLDLIASSHNIKLRLNIARHPLPVEADESKLRQVIMNFIDNAIYYSHSKSTIVINIEKINDSVALTVTDTGIGVPAEEQTKLFHKFFRAKNARKQRPDGTGVGLYLARRVVTAHGGSIIFSSKEGKGSTFGFRLPLDKSKVEQKAPESEPLVAATK